MFLRDVVVFLLMKAILDQKPSGDWDVQNSQKQQFWRISILDVFPKEHGLAIPAFSLLSIGPVWYCATSTAEGRLWRSSTALVTMKKHCKRLSDQIVCHMSYYESIWPYESILTIWPLSITFGKFIKLPTKRVTCATCTSLRRGNVRNFADSLGFVLNKPAFNHVLLDRFEFFWCRGLEKGLM